MLEGVWATINLTKFVVLREEQLPQNNVVLREEQTPQNEPLKLRNIEN